MSVFDKINTDRPLVVYGAGYTARGVYQQLFEKGFRPVCFCDKDEKKHGTYFKDLEIPVVPIMEALKKYKDFQIYVSTFSSIRYEIFEYLINNVGISPDDIINYEEYEKRKSCKYVEGFCGFRRDIVWCCHKPAYSSKEAPPRFLIEGNDYQRPLERFFQERSELIEKLRINQDTACKGCGNLRTIFTRTDTSRIDTLSFGSSNNYSYCNFRCAYCGNVNPTQKLSEHYSPADVVRYLEAEGRISPEYTLINSGNGEICLTPRGGELLDLFKRYISQIMTNASMYSEKIEDLLRSGMTQINVSVDAGTRETFAKIKGSDSFDVVRENLIRYGKTKGVILAKYIFLPGQNDSRKDVEGFLNLCKEIGPVKVRLSYDYNDVEPIVGEKFDNLAHFCRIFRENGYNVECFEEGVFPLQILEKLKTV